MPAKTVPIIAGLLTTSNLLKAAPIIKAAKSEDIFWKKLYALTILPSFSGFDEFWIMVTAGDLHGSPKRNRPAVKAIDSQKLSVIRTEAQNIGIAMRFPAMHT